MKTKDSITDKKTVTFIPLSTDKNQEYQYPKGSKILGLVGFDDTQHLVILRPKEVEEYIPLKIEIHIGEEEIDMDDKEYIGCIYSGYNVKVVFKIKEK